MDPIRQTAILVAALDMDSADALLEQMPDDFAAAVRNCVMELTDVDPNEEQQIISQFLGKQERPQGDTLEVSADLTSTPDAMSLEDFLSQKVEDSSEPVVDPTQQDKAGTPFEFLQNCDAFTLLAAIENEHPQTIALVLSHVDASLAASVLGRLSDEQQVDVARRIADLDEVDAQTLTEVDSALRSLAATGRHGGRAGWNAIQKIIASADQSGSNILKNLERADQQLASQLVAATEQAEKHTLQKVAGNQDTRRQTPVTSPVDFDDLIQLTDSELGKVLQKADGRTLLLALAGARPKFIQKVYSQLPRDDAKSLQRQIEQQGTIRLRDVEEAQRRIGLVAASLAASDEINLPPKRRLAVAA